MIRSIRYGRTEDPNYRKVSLIIIIWQLSTVTTVHYLHLHQLRQANQYFISKRLVRFSSALKQNLPLLSKLILLKNKELKNFQRF